MLKKAPKRKIPKKTWKLKFAVANKEVPILKGQHLKIGMTCTCLSKVKKK